MRILNISVCTLIVLIVSSCNLHGQQNRANAQAINNRALKLYQEHSNDKDSLERAITLLDSAIKIYPTYKLAYINKGAIYCLLGSYQEMLKVLDKAIVLDKENPQLFIIQGHILEKTGRNYEAMLKYRKADSIYSTLIKSKPNSIRDKVDKAYLQCFLTNKEQGIIEYEKIANSNTDPYVASAKTLFYDFNRGDFIKNFCLPVN